MSHHLVQAKEVFYAYPDGQPALRGVSFLIHHGESVALIGSNGAGKSTLLLHLNGVLKPSSGQIRIGDFPITQKNLAEMRRTVGLIFQDSDDQLFMPTVFDDVAFGLSHQGLTAQEIESRVDQALATVGATHLKERPPYRLSGGEKRAVAIAGVLVMHPSILVMDEPSNGLDPAARRRLIKLLASFDHTKIIATHDLDLVLDLCTRVLVMNQGVIEADGTSADIFADADLLQRCNLEPPLSLQRR
ncbi:energy-coupling factor ABC transporter ATP-binding protein [Rhodoferax sp.]|uniref:energy-coupling factor ABC transporter ATP-binding protein n=1 Tax=Rhodoferax sp. TaxID=50421 RepID=UPI002845C7A4|nr:energy-coupling factor ABC transporter ATP-binding protein [Rhodoferax sp.]MDR3370908.1 energy-coupling factor ABC transporter ATP-binding protein [Rhodoferax sp.]